MSEPKWPLKKRVEVEWVDSASGAGWAPIEEYMEDAREVLCRSTGYLLKKDGVRLVLVQSQGKRNKTVTESIAIPLVNVLRIRVLKGGLD